MRPSRLAVIAAPFVFVACLEGSDVTQPNRGTPIDCQTLATTLAASEPTLTTTASGLKYRDQTVGTGTVVTNGLSIRVHYSGCLTTGQKFDENTDADPPLQFVVGDTRLIAGFNEGVLGMKVGGRRQLVLPPSLAYGSTGSGIIPPNATIVFTVDLLSAQ